MVVMVAAAALALAAQKAAEKRAMQRRLKAKPKRTGADKALEKLIKEADGLRVCLKKIGPKGRGITLFTMLTEGTKLTCISSDNTRGLKCVRLLLLRFVGARCERASDHTNRAHPPHACICVRPLAHQQPLFVDCMLCLLYTSDAADE